MILFLISKEDSSKVDFISMIDNIDVKNELDINMNFSNYTNIIFVNDFVRLSKSNINIKDLIRPLEFLYNIKFCYIHENKPDNILTNLMSTFNVKLKSLNIELLQELLSGIIRPIANDLSDKNKVIELCTNILNNYSYDFLIHNHDVIYNIINDYINTLLDNDTLNKKINLLTSKLDSKEIALKEMESELNLYVDAYNYNTVLYDNLRVEYSKYGMNHDTVSKIINVDEYTNAPIIIYLKELTELHYYDNYLSILKNTIESKRSLSCKVVRLVDNTYRKKLNSVSKDYFIALDLYDMNKIITSDKIIKEGDYTKVLDTLLKNSMSLDVLIISDERSNEQFIIEGSMIINFYILSNYKDYKAYDVDPYNVISNNGDISWKHIDNYDNTKPNILIYQLSEMKAVTEVILTLDYLIKNAYHN